ncbi:hypothetical protein [Micromonospora tulbaghiae]
MSPSHEFSVDDVDAAIDFVIRNGAEDRGQTVSYSRVFDAAGLPAPQYLHMDGDPQRVTEFMEAFHNRCKERQLPPWTRSSCTSPPGALASRDRATSGSTALPTRSRTAPSRKP